MNLRLINISLPLASFTLEVETEIREPATVLFGPSGAGKTTLLEIVAGLRRPASGRVEIDGQTLNDSATGLFIPPRNRSIGYVPQDLALFPHLSVRQNLLYARRRPGPNPPLTFERVVHVLELEGLLARGIRGLSGGEKRRVALARALLASPKLLLLDEPLSNLDRSLKSRILSYLGLIRDEFHLPMLYVTHDAFEALTLGNSIIVLVNGRIAQSGSALDVFNNPSEAALPAIERLETVERAKVVSCTGNLATAMVGQTALISATETAPRVGGDVLVCIRAEDVVLVKTHQAALEESRRSPEKGGAHGTARPALGSMESSARNRLPGVIRAITPHGPMVRIDLDCGFLLAAVLTSQACRELDLAPNDRVTALVKAPHVHLIPRAFHTEAHNGPRARERRFTAEDASQ